MVDYELTIKKMEWHLQSGGWEWRHTMKKCKQGDWGVHFRCPLSNAFRHLCFIVNPKLHFC